MTTPPTDQRRWEKRIRAYAAKRGWLLRHLTPARHPNPTYLLIASDAQGMTTKEVERALNYQPLRKADREHRD